MDRTYVIRLVRPFIKFLFELWSIWYETKVQDMLEVNNRVETVTATPASNNMGKYMTGAFPHFEYLLGNGIFHSNLSYDKSSSWITHCFYEKKKKVTNKCICMFCFMSSSFSFHLFVRLEWIRDIWKKGSLHLLEFSSKRRRKEKSQKYRIPERKGKLRKIQICNDSFNCYINRVLKTQSRHIWKLVC